MKKANLAILLLSVLAVSAIGFVIYNEKIIKSQKVEIARLKVEVSEIADAKDDLEEKAKELQDQLDNVQHFDDEAVVRRGYTSGNSGSVAFTGGFYQGKIDGEFEGWEGETIFKMMDGSIWQQASYAYTYHYAYMPDVIIFSKNGTTYMKVEDVDDVIQVRRLN